MEKLFNIICIIAIAVLIVFLIPAITQARLLKRVEGRIVVSIENGGEAWYVRPETRTRQYLGDADHAFEVMREQALGMTDADFVRLFGVIPGTQKEPYFTKDTPLAGRLSGRFLLRVDHDGEAYYLFPEDGRGYYIGNPVDMRRIIERLGQRMADRDVKKIVMQ